LAAKRARLRELERKFSSEHVPAAEVEGVRKGAESAGKLYRGARGLTYAEARAAREVVRLRGEALRLEREAGRLVVADEVQDGVAAMVVRFRARCLAIPARLADRLAVEASAVACQGMMRDEIEQALGELAGAVGGSNAS
jgi:hypothetical protein